MNELNQNKWVELKKRYIGLDIFRIVSILMICAFHTNIHLKANYGIFHNIISVGAFFMTAFFMLSGYLLFVNHSSESILDIKNLKQFFIKRFIGIVPMYYISALLFILNSFILYKLGENDTFSLSNEFLLAPIEFFGIQSNFHSIFKYSHNGGTWFISCILMCYFIYPFIQEIAKSISIKSRVKIICLFCFILVYSMFIAYKFGTENIYSNSFFRILEFTIGVMLASMKIELDKNIVIKKIFYNWITILIVNIIMIVVITKVVNLDFKISKNNYMFYSSISLPFLIFLLIGLSGVKSKILENSRIIKYCCKIGYVFFLAQLYSNVISKIIIKKFSISNNILIIILGWGICITITILLHEIFEKNIKKVLNKKINKNQKQIN